MAHYYPERPIIVEAYAPPPYTDLAASQFYINVDHSNRRICVGAVVRNLGGAPPERSWVLTIGIIYEAQGTQYSIQECFTIPQNQIIGSGGFYTPCAEAQLVYRDEDSGAVYKLEAHVDACHELVDLDRGSNILQGTHWWINPATAAKYKRFKLDMTGERPRIIESEEAGH